MPNVETGAVINSTGCIRHVVYTRSTTGTETIYVDGNLAVTQTREGDFSNWADMKFALGNEFNSSDWERWWVGTLHLVAIYDRAISGSEVAQNFAAGGASDVDLYDGWTNCAAENGQCDFTGTKEVRYGANGSYFYLDLTDGTACTNAVFGDPLVGTTKECDYR